MFVKFILKDDVRGKDGVSIFEGNAAHIKQPKLRVGHGIREISDHPKEDEGFENIRVITLEREGEESLRFLINLNDIRDDKLWVFIMNNHGETIDKIIGY